ncbi:MAG: OmpA family protein [Deltaproteobacteria bacterium]|nr:OmpA family protein [Deltaproteobacteria bacterium]
MSDQKKLKQRLEHSERRRSRIQRLLVRAPREEDPFLWSMVDIMTLLLIFFIIMYASISNRAQAQTTAQIHLPQEKARTLPEPEQMLRDDVDNLLEANKALHVRWESAQPVFVLGEHITFEEGQAELIPASLSLLEDLAGFIVRRSEYRVIVTGHTDDVPIHTSRYPSNWELSSARAASVVRFFCNNGVDAGRLSVQGYGEYDPFVSNTSEHNRQANRRVEISLVRQSRING